LITDLGTIVDVATNWRLQYSLKFHVQTEVSVVHIPDWTRGHQHGDIPRSTHSKLMVCLPHSLHACQLNRVSQFLAGSGGQP